jgi:hypothetical protein
MKKEVEIKTFKDWGKLVKISSVKGFYKWLRGQTIPVVSEDKDPFDWAYYGDYDRFINNKPIVD